MLEEQPVPAAQPAQPAPAQPVPAAKPVSDDNLMAALSYWYIISIIILLVKKDSDYVKFHAKQGLVLFGAFVIWWFILQFLVASVILSGGIFLLTPIVWLGQLVILGGVIVGTIKAYSGEKYRIPVVADLADKFNI